MKILQAVFRVREKFLLPGVASPTDPLAKLVLRCLVPPQRPCLVPVHVENHHVDRDVQRADLLSKPHELEVTTVQRPRRSEQIAAVIHPRMPSHCPKAFSGSRIRHSECHIQIILIEFVISRICQRDVLSFDCQLLAGPFHCVNRNRQFSVDHTEGGPVLELSIRGPFHTHQPALQHSEPRVARNDNRFWISHRIIPGTLCRS